MNYQIREARKFSDDIDALEQKFPRIKELKAAIAFALCIDPHRFVQVEENQPFFRILRTDDLAGITDQVPTFALHFMYYNLVRTHKTLRVTPAMEAGLTTKLWEIEDLAKLTE